MYTRVHEIFFGLPRIQKIQKSLSRQNDLGTNSRGTTQIYT